MASDEEFNLSDNICFANETIKEYIHIDDVKEFIKRLKEQIKGRNLDETGLINRDSLMEVLDELAGSKLIEGE